MADEPSLTCRLADLFPELVQALLAVHQENGWIVLPDIGPPIREALAGEKMAVFDLFAQMQRRSETHVDGLLEARSPDQKLSRIEAQIPELERVEAASSGLSESTVATISTSCWPGWATPSRAPTSATALALPGCRVRARPT